MIIQIHGKLYDVSRFKDSHPGGSRLLESCDGIDATAAFESYHALANRRRIDAQLGLLEVPATSSMMKTHASSFALDGFYSDLRQRVAKKLEGRNTKWTYEWLAWATGTFLVYCFSFYVAFLRHDINFILRGLASAGAGTAMICTLLQAYHDASHSALSPRAWINEAVLLFGSGLALWDAETWTRHHAVLHHSFTGDYTLDPDTRHTHPFLKKSPKSKAKGVSSKGAITLVLSVVPGMFLGQIIAYMHIQYSKFLWGFSIRNRKPLLEWVIVMSQIGMMIYGRSVTLVLTYFLFLNLNYSVFILPDHDQLRTIGNHKEGDMDWGEMQVRNSGNFCTGNMILTRLYGGINYQIEHHLFPSLCSWHLPEISQVVKETCAEHGVPYVSDPTLLGAYRSAVMALHHGNR
jgi:linoleoyl-CoA desaturase